MDRLSFQGMPTDMPAFRDANGMVYVWDAESHTYVPSPDHDQHPDRGHATGGDNDLFDPFQHTEESGVPELEGYMSKTALEWASRGQVNCPNCQTTTDSHVCPQCGKDLTPEWNRSDDRDNEFMDVHPPFDARNEFISDPERVPKRNQMKTDDSYPSMNLSHYAPLSRVKPLTFSHVDEELAWHAANAPSLEDCPECGDVMHEQDGEKVCHGCGHKQKIIEAKTAAPLIPEAMGLLGGGVADAGAGAGAAGLLGGEGAGGISGIGGLMNSALGRGVAFRSGEDLVPGGSSGGTPGGYSDYGASDNASVAPGVISHKQAGLIGDLVEFLVGKMKAAPEAFADPTNPLSYADDIAGAAIPSGHQQAMAHTAKGTFGEEEVGRGTKNDGTNSDPDEASNSSIEGEKEHGDSPEQLKDSEGLGGTTSPDEAGQLADQGDPQLQEKALKAFHMNKPLVIEFASSDEAGTDNPILLALDALLEEAFPGYREGTGDTGSEHPLEGNDEEAPSEDESGEKPEEGDSKEDKKPDSKESSTWAKEGLWSFAFDSPYDISPGDVIAAYSDGTIVLDDGIATFNPERAKAFVEAGGQLQDAATKKEAAMPLAPAIRQGLDMPTQWGSGQYPGEQMAPGAPGVAAAPQVCPNCGQNHAPGTPCVQDASQNIPQPMANGAPVTPGAPNIVTTKIAKWQIISGPIMLPDPQIQKSEESLEQLPGVTSEQNPNAENVVARFDDEFGFYTADDHAIHHPTHDVEWIDTDGAPLQEGHEYDLVANEYAIPDKVTISRILPDKITYKIHASPQDPSSLPYESELTKQALATEGYKFTPIEEAQQDFTPEEHPIRPGQDATPQVDDLSTPSSVVSHFDPLNSDPRAFTGAFNGDRPDNRSWILEGGSSEVAVDPALMAKLAGKDYSGQEQRAFIEEEGMARNLDKLDLEGTHYLSDELDSAFNW